MDETNELPLVPLADLLERVKRPVTLVPDESYRTLGVRWYGGGVFAKERLLGSQIKAKTLFRVESGDVIYSRLFAWKGSFGVATREQSGAMVSNEFPTYRASSELLPEYFMVWASQAALWRSAEDASTGTTSNSRNRLSEDDFLALEIPLPSVEVQAEIVRVVRRLDVLVSRLERVIKCGYQALRVLQGETFATMEAERVPIKSFTRVTTGGTPLTSNPDYFNGDIPFVKTGDVAFRDIVEVAERISESGLKNSSAKLVPAGSVLVAMYGRGTVGRSAVLSKSMATNQACASILPSKSHSSRFLFHFLWRNYEELIDQAEGTTNLTNISKAIVEETELPLPRIEEQHRVANQLDALLDVVRADEDELDALKALRPTLVAVLLRDGLPDTGEKPDKSTADPLTVAA